MIQHGMFFIAEAFIGMKRSPLMSVVAMTTIMTALVLLGVFLIINLNIRYLSGFMTSQLEIRVFLQQSLTTEQISTFKKKLTQLDGVKTIQFVNKNTAWANFTKNYHKLNLNKIIENPLPHSFKINVHENYDIFKMTEYIKLHTNYITDVKNGGVLNNRVYAFIKWLKYSGVFLILLLFLATLLIVVNTIRLTIINRQEEISIMKLVGATNFFIKGPFLIEGAIIGVIGSSSAILFLNHFYSYWGQKLQEGLPFIPIVFDQYILNQVYLYLGLSGIILGIFGAYISVSKSLKLTA